MLIIAQTASSFQPMQANDMLHNVNLSDAGHELKPPLMMLLPGNVIKYTGGEKKVTVTLKKQERVELRARNTGAPIPAEMLPHIFEHFYR